MPNREARVAPVLLLALAGAILFTGGLAVGLAVRQDGTPGVSLLPGLAAPSSPKASELYARIAAHPFWRVKVTPAQVEALVAKIREEKRDTIAYVDDHFVYGAYRAEGDVGPAIVDFGHAPDLKPDSVGGRYVSLNLQKAFRSRPTAEAISAELLFAVREREYKD